MAKNKVKFLLNLLLVALNAIPRGGEVVSRFEEPAGKTRFEVRATGKNARVPPLLLDFLNGTFEEHMDAHAVQPLYTLKLAEAAGIHVSVSIDGERVTFRGEVAW